MKPEDQLKEWLKGNSIHNDERNECTPDFSCCNEDLLALKLIREEFYDAWNKKDNDTLDKLLGYFLKKLLDKKRMEAKIVQ